MTTQTGRHAFLRSLHELLKPARYLEIGVQFGHSLRQALPTTDVIGVDPEPLVSRPVNGRICRMTSDEYFLHTTTTTNPHPPVDFAFIDGMHLVEFALRDFINCESVAAPSGVIVLDDVLPYLLDIAGREPLPGDWTGDVWKLWPILRKWRPELKVTLVDVDPTGLMVVQGLDPNNGPQLLRAYYDQISATWAVDVDLGEEVAATIIGRASALQPDEALKAIEEIHNLERG